MNGQFIALGMYIDFLSHLTDTVDPWLSESRYSAPQLSKCQSDRSIKVLSIGVCSIRVNDCSIRVFGRSPGSKLMDFSYLDKFTYLLRSLEQRCLDN